ncbi:MAG: helix-hairpin-helix domain-containing protein [Clostridia bacterium]|nr:helix-hairpin-helix domain-containing protein [Clostridia bacterium]
MENIPTKAQIAVIVILGVFIFFGGIKYQQIRLSNIELEIVGTIDNLGTKQTAEEEEKKAEKKLVVHVVGAVEKPDIYTFAEGARVNDAVQAAVPLAAADLSQLNLSLPLQDGKQIDVPLQASQQKTSSVKPVQKPKTNSFAQVTPADKLGVPVPAENTGDKININTASREELMKLSRIGPAIADRIIAYREKEGSFRKIEDIKKVSGIGEVTFAKLKDQISVE